MKCIFAALIVSLCLTGCLPMSDERAARALEAGGYQNIELEGMAIFGCAEDDTFRKAFSATDRHGKRVTGAVCGGWLKGATVRID